MKNFELSADEVILYEGNVTSDFAGGKLKLTLTSEKMVFEKERGFFRKELDFVEVFLLDTIKFYKGEPQIRQKGNRVMIQTAEETCRISFPGMFEAMKFTGRLMDTVTGTTLAERSTDKVISVIGTVSDALGFSMPDSRKK